MPRIIGINGIDNSGKTTIVRGISDYLKAKNIDVYIPSHPWDVRPDLFPPKDEFIQWYKHESPVEVVSVLLTAYRDRDSLCEASDSLSLIDRGYLTEFSACMSHFMTKQCMQLDDAFNVVKELNYDIGYRELSDDIILLTFPVSLYATRGTDAGYDNQYRQYLKNLEYSINFVKQDYEDLLVMDATQNVDSIIKGILNTICD